MAEDKEIDAELAWAEIQAMLITSNYYTARDKNEIHSQSEWFNNVANLEELKDSLGQTLPWAEGCAAAARKQLTLYYMVGSYGWDTALRSVKAIKSAAIGMPAPVEESVSYAHTIYRPLPDSRNQWRG